MTSGHTAGEPPSLHELVETRRWQRLQDHFANVLGVALRTITPAHELVVEPSWPPGVASDQAIGLLKVGDELGTLVPPQDPPQETTSITIPLGVTYAAVPIRVTPGQVIAYFVVGPMVVGPREDKLRFRERMSAMGADAEAVWNLLLTLRPYSFSGIQSLLNLLEEVGASLTQFAYQANRLAALLPPANQVDQAVVSYYTDRVLHALLEVAAMATRAEGGSVMTYEGPGDVLKIRAARGLSDAVVLETRQKRGEGLAGIAVSQPFIFLIDEQTADASLKPLMHRREIVSSLIAPIVPDPEREPIGVLNLRTTSRERRFTPEHVEMLRRLLDLTSVALGNLRLAFTKPS